MVPLADFGHGLMMPPYDTYPIDFFALVNIRGALVSLAIGVIIYVFIVRGCLMTRDESGRSLYINLWPKPLDLEHKLYRPVLLNVLPFIGAFFARIIGSLLTAISVFGFRVFVAVKDYAQKKQMDLAAMNEKLLKLGLRGDRQINFSVINERLSNFVATSWSKDMGDRFYVFRTLINSLPYGILLAMVGMVVVLLFILPS